MPASAALRPSYIFRPVLVPYSASTRSWWYPQIDFSAFCRVLRYASTPATVQRGCLFSMTSIPAEVTRSNFSARVGAYVSTIHSNSACWAAIGLCCLAAPTSAAEFRRDRGEEIVAPVYMDGEIEPGDHKKLLDILGEDVGQKGMPLFIQLNSKGGNFEEAIKIADVARERFLSTKLGPGSTCLSACAIVFMSGMNYNNSFFTKSRVMHPTAVLGFHAPSITSGGGNFDAADLEAAYSRGVEQVGKKLLAVARYRVESWTNPRIKPSLVNEMMMARGSNLFYVDTVGKAAEFEIDLDGAIGPPAATQSNLRNACRNAAASVADAAVGDEAGEWLKKFEATERIDPENEAKVQSFEWNRAKGRFCDVEVRTHFADSNPEYEYEENLIKVGVGGSTQSVPAPDWYFWPSDTKLTSITGR